MVQPAGRLRYTAAHRPARIVPPIWMQSGPSWSSEINDRWSEEGPPTPPALGSAPAQPWRSSILRCVLGLEGLDFAQFPITSPPSTLSAWPVM